jgi:GT2 family glycosyltransferase
MTDQELLHLEDQAFVEQAYVEALGRASDAAGLKNYLERIRGGVSKAQVLAELRDSDEGRRHASRRGRPFGTRASSPTSARSFAAATPQVRDLLRLSDPAFVERAYRLVLGRGVDPSGRANYLQELRVGVSRLDVLHELLQSAEGQRVNAPLPELRAALARRRLQRMPGVRQALRLMRRVRLQLRGPAAVPAHMHGTSLPAPHSMASEGADPLRPRTGQRHGCRPQTNPLSMMSNSTVEPLGQPDSRLNAATTSTEDGTAGAGMTLAAASEGESDSAPACELHLESLTGPTLHGWSTMGGRPAAVSVALADRSIGRIIPTVPRPEIQVTHQLGSETVGFEAALGGLLQFAAMMPACSALRLTQQGAGGAEVTLDLQQHLPEALTFAPMRALMRAMPRDIGQIRSMRLVSTEEVALLFEAAALEAEPVERVFIDFYQAPRSPAAAGGALQRVARFAIELGGQLQDLQFRLPDVRQPLLMVVTDTERNIVTTDCFPLPVIFAEAYAPLIEYHVVLENGTQGFEAAAKIARSYFDGVLDARRSPPAAGLPHREHTAVVLYSRGATELPLRSLFASYAALGTALVVLDHLGQAHRSDGAPVPLADYVAASPKSHFLLHDAESELRPDFWSVLSANAFRLSAEAEVVHWHSLWLDGITRPQLVKGGLLLDPAFAGHTLLEARSALVSRGALQRAMGRFADRLASGRLCLEQALCEVAANRVACVPVLMQIIRYPITPLQAQRFKDDHVTLPMHPGQVAAASGGPGVSAIINYRDSVSDTVRCLESLARQQLDGPLEVVLINNGSSAASRDSILARARELFGTDRLKAIDYPHRFNHSTQCNVGAQAARHDLLLMLSNDSVLLTPRAVARAAAVANVPWVASCGFRIIGNHGNKRRLQSLGLGLTPRRHLFSGGSPVARNVVPSFALDCTIEVIGNTFAAVMLRRDVYRKLDGLDSEAFPTNHNDIDYSFRALNAGYRHVAMGSELVEHVGRGSREADQDQPIDQRIIERSPRLDVLARLGFQQL